MIKATPIIFFLLTTGLVMGQYNPKIEFYTFPDSVKNRILIEDFAVVKNPEDKNRSGNYLLILTEDDTLRQIEVKYGNLLIPISLPSEFQANPEDFFVIEFNINLNGNNECYWVHLCCIDGTRGRGLFGPAGEDCNNKHFVQIITK